MLSVYRSKLLAIRLKRDMHTKNYTRLCGEEASYPFPPKELPLVLVNAYNMHYTEGCTNLYTFLKVVFFNHKSLQKRQA